MAHVAKVFAGLLVPAIMLAQAAGSVQASGTATVSANPDQANLSVGVVTDGATAQAAAQSNASATTAVLNALKQVLGAAGSIQTASYSLSPRYAPQQQSQTIIGFTASNTLQVTTADLSLIGNLIDAAYQAGANNVGGLAFSLMNPEPLRQQALGQAAKQARAHADAIAAGLGAKTGTVISAQEGTGITPLAVGTAAGTATPIQTGQVSVTATVTITVQLSQ